MTIDEPQLTPVDHVSQALKLASQRQRIIELERLHAAGYQQHPVQPQEFEIAESDLVLGDT